MQPALGIACHPPPHPQYLCQANMPGAPPKGLPGAIFRDMSHPELFVGPGMHCAAHLPASALLPARNVVLTDPAGLFLLVLRDQLEHHFRPEACLVLFLLVVGTGQKAGRDKHIIECRCLRKAGNGALMEIRFGEVAATRRVFKEGLLEEVSIQLDQMIGRSRQERM